MNNEEIDIKLIDQEIVLVLDSIKYTSIKDLTEDLTFKFVMKEYQRNERRICKYLKTTRPEFYN